MIRSTHASPKTAPDRRGEQGYALITILVFLAVLSVMLARMLPRDAMSAQRTREETLIYRGEEYSRAVKLYFREHKKYPESLDDLEETNDVRYLRRRYKDPITGEDEWRLIKMGPDGRFKDSLIYDTEDPEDPTQAGGFGGSRGGMSGGMSGMSTGLSSNRGGARDQTAYASAYGLPPQGFAGADRVRDQRESAAPDNPFDRSQGPYGGGLGAQTPGDPGQPQIGPDGQPVDPNNAQPDYTQVPPGQVPDNAGQRPPGAPQQVNPFMPGANQNSARGQRGNRLRQQPGAGFPGFGQQAQAMPTGGQPAGFGREGMSPQAADVIGRLLTTPRPGGLAGIQNQGMQTGAPQAAFTEGIAGVASKSEHSGVKVYKGYELYKEWEFVYDYREDSSMQGMGAAGGLAGGGGNIAPGQPGMGRSGVLTGNPGAASGFGAAVPGMPGAPIDPNAAQPGQYPNYVNTAPDAEAPSDPGDNPSGVKSPARYRPASPGIPGLPVPGDIPPTVVAPSPAPQPGGNGNIRTLPTSRFGQPIFQQPQQQQQQPDP